MANTPPKGRFAPASLTALVNTPHLDPVALHGEAINACAMATYYTRKGNHAGAARKTVQALAALRRLAALRSLDGADVCASPSTQGGAA